RLLTVHGRIGAQVDARLVAGSACPQRDPAVFADAIAQEGRDLLRASPCRRNDAHVPVQREAAVVDLDPVGLRDDPLLRERALRRQREREKHQGDEMSGHDRCSWRSWLETWLVPGVGKQAAQARETRQDLQDPAGRKKIVQTGSECPDASCAKRSSQAARPPKTRPGPAKRLRIGFMPPSTRDAGPVARDGSTSPGEPTATGAMRRRVTVLGGRHVRTGFHAHRPGMRHHRHSALHLPLPCRTCRPSTSPFRSPRWRMRVRSTAACWVARKDAAATAGSTSISTGTRSWRTWRRRKRARWRRTTWTATTCRYGISGWCWRWTRGRH